MIFASPAGNSSDQIAAWARRLTDDLNRFASSIDNLPTFEDDGAAQAGNLKIGQRYVTSTGEYRERVS